MGKAFALFVILIWMGLSSAALAAKPSEQNPQFFIGIGAGYASTKQNADAAKGSWHAGLATDAAYSPFDRWFFGYDIYTFTPIENVRASNYMASVSYRLPKFTFSGLMGLQTSIDGRADGATPDPLTGYLLQKENNSLSYGLKVSYDSFIPLGRDDFSLGLSPVIYWVKTTEIPNFSEWLLMLELRVWVY